MSFVSYKYNSMLVHPEESSVVYKGNLKLWILKKDEGKKKNGHQHEWVQMYNIVDMFHNTIVPRTFIHSALFIVAVVTYPTPKIIFGVSKYEEGGIDEFCSYDVKLEILDSVIKTNGKHFMWHVSSLAHL
ncbi:hypothetical protein MKX03_032422 [Papaver bracteatum]|nr:hypothetical protein MKX03_032422 [Papaver bracteatum]